MKLRKKDFKVRRNLPFAPWRISISSVESPVLREVAELGPGELTTANTRKCNSHREKIHFHGEENPFSWGRKSIARYNRQAEALEKGALSSYLGR